MLRCYPNNIQEDTVHSKLPNKQSSLNDTLNDISKFPEHKTLNLRGKSYVPCNAIARNPLSPLSGLHI